MCIFVVCVAPQNQPTEVKVKVLGADSIWVDWRGVSTAQLEEPLVGYMVWKSFVDINVAKWANCTLLTVCSVNVNTQSSMSF